MSERVHLCLNIRPPRRSTLPPGQQQWKPCNRPADLFVDIHQASDHRKVGNGWFRVAICNECFDAEGRSVATRHTGDA